jgi:hypothetical protein
MEDGDERVHLHQQGERLTYAAGCSQNRDFETRRAALGAAIQSPETPGVLHPVILRVEMSGDSGNALIHV